MYKLPMPSESAGTVTDTKTASPTAVALAKPQLRLVYHEFYRKRTDAFDFKAASMQTNQGFVALLNTTGVYNKGAMTVEDINTIVGAIENGYRQGTFYDSDLSDDNFEHFQIVSPFTAHDPRLKAHFIKTHLDKFEDAKACEVFLKDRSKVFCLYVFFRRCAILYRDAQVKKPLTLLLNLLQDKKQMDKVKALIRVEAVRFSQDNWNTGLHEWLTCQSTQEALRRTAGLAAGIETCIAPVAGDIQLHGHTERPFYFSEFNWLDFQLLVRTPTKDVIFSHNLHGHVGAVNRLMYPPTATTGAQKSGEKGFHDHINTCFSRSKSVSQYIGEIASYYESALLHEATPYPITTTAANYLVDGTMTNNAHGLTLFRQNKLCHSHRMMHIWLRDLQIQIELVNLGDQDILTCTYEFKRVLPVGLHVHKAVNAVAASLKATFTN